LLSKKKDSGFLQNGFHGPFTAELSAATIWAEIYANQCQGERNVSGFTYVFVEKNDDAASKV
jgi:hypothetical protein